MERKSWLILELLYCRLVIESEFFESENIFTRPARGQQYDLSIFYIISDLVPIKRESSRRKAKEGNLKKMHMQERLLEDDDEGGLPGLDLSDSDDDATWNPQMDKPANDMRSR